MCRERAWPFSKGWEERSVPRAYELPGCHLDDLHTRAPAAVFADVAALLLVGCGGSSPTVARQPRTTASSTGRSPSISSTAELLSVPAVGLIYGRCKRGDRVGTIEFAVGPQTATDSVTYRIGPARPRTVDSGPGSETLPWRLVPGRFTANEPADPVSGFPTNAVSGFPANAIRRPNRSRSISGKRPSRTSSL